MTEKALLPLADARVRLMLTALTCRSGQLHLAPYGAITVRIVSTHETGQSAVYNFPRRQRPRRSPLADTKESKSNLRAHLAVTLCVGSLDSNRQVAAKCCESMGRLNILVSIHVFRFGPHAPD